MRIKDILLYSYDVISDCLMIRHKKRHKPFMIEKKQFLSNVMNLDKVYFDHLIIFNKAFKEALSKEVDTSIIILTKIFSPDYFQWSKITIKSKMENNNVYIIGIIKNVDKEIKDSINEKYFTQRDEHTKAFNRKGLNAWLINNAFDLNDFSCIILQFNFDTILDYNDKLKKYILIIKNFYADCIAAICRYTNNEIIILVKNKDNLEIEVQVNKLLNLFKKEETTIIPLYSYSISNNETLTALIEKARRRLCKSLY